jgi:FtsZ-binding cell division protein ZapB
MKRIISSTLLLALSSLPVWAQAGKSAPPPPSAGPIVGWSLAIVGVILVLVVIARRLSMGQAWKFEVPVALVGALLLNFGIWQLVANKIEDLKKDNTALKNQITASKRLTQELQAVGDQMRHQLIQWQTRDQDWQKLLGDWQTYAGSLKQRLDSITAARAARTGPAPAKSTSKGGASKKKP